MNEWKDLIDNLEVVFKDGDYDRPYVVVNDDYYELFDWFEVKLGENEGLKDKLEDLSKRNDRIWEEYDKLVNYYYTLQEKLEDKDISVEPDVNTCCLGKNEDLRYILDELKNEVRYSHDDMSFLIAENEGLRNSNLDLIETIQMYREVNAMVSEDLIGIARDANEIEKTNEKLQEENKELKRQRGTCEGRFSESL